MITPEQLAEYAKLMREMGITKFKCGDLELEIGRLAAPEFKEMTTPKDDYEKLLFAATEGIPDDEASQ